VRSSMLEFILSSGNIPFTVALGIMVALAALEVLSLLLGFALSGFVDQFIPDIDVDADLDGVPDHPTLSAVADWLHVGDAPALALFIVFLTAFGVSGWGVQYLAVEFLSRPLSPWLAAIPAFAAGVLAMRLVGGLLVKVGIRDETTAVSADSLLGATAQITLGTARAGEPSQAKLKDKHGQTHYVLVEPLRPGEEFPHGATVTLVRRDGPKYFVVEDSVDALLALETEDLPASQRLKA
jgi:hypothetical protein